MIKPRLFENLDEVNDALVKDRYLKQIINFPEDEVYNLPIFSNKDWILAMNIL